MEKNIVIALGGNALGNTPSEQLDFVKTTASSIVSFIKLGHNIILTHGNGPQVGMINLSTSFASEKGAGTPVIPFPECGAMSQGYIGYHLQQAVENQLEKENIKKDVATIVTQVLVDQNDPAFFNPTKPVGAFYTKDQSEKIALENGYTFVEDSGRGYRRVVPSPAPMEIIELNTVKQLINSGTIVITAGGGGIPVIRTANGLLGVSAVIDKDRSSAVLAHKINADMLIILTAIEKVCINFNTKDQQELDSLSYIDGQKYMSQNQFGKGSMQPKVQACLDFVKGNPKRTALITSLEKAKDALAGKTGTKIYFTED